MVYVDGLWCAVDMTCAISSRNTQAQTFSACVTDLADYTTLAA